MKLNRKGFTLIELLAVIVILGVLLAIAVPSVSKYISVSKKSTYIDNAQSYASVARDQAMLGTYKFPVNTNEATLIHFSDLTNYLDKGGKNSPYGNAYETSNSFVIIANVNTAEDPKYEYYIAAVDEEGYGIGVLNNNTATAQAITYNDLKTENIIQLGLDGNGNPNGLSAPTKGNKITLSGKSITITKVYP